jgi:hypothetical protein
MSLQIHILPYLPTPKTTIFVYARLQFFVCICHQTREKTTTKMSIPFLPPPVMCESTSPGCLRHHELPDLVLTADVATHMTVAHCRRVGQFIEHLMRASAIATEGRAVAALDLPWAHNTRNRAAGTGAGVRTPCELRELSVVLLPPCNVVLAAAARAHHSCSVRAARARARPRCCMWEAAGILKPINTSAPPLDEGTSLALPV